MMLRFLWITALVAAGVAAQPKPKSAFDKATFEAYVRHLNLFVPQVKVAVGDPTAGALPGFKEVKVQASMGEQRLDQVYFISDDGQRIVEGRVFDINQSPFAEDLAKLKTEYQPSMGTPGAPVVIVLFSDFECHYCREESKQLRENLLKAYPKEVRLYFKDLPLEAIHPWAKPAANAGRCVFRQNALAFWDFHDWIFENQKDIKADNLRDKVMEWSQGKPALNKDQLAVCLDKQGALRDVEKNIADARALGLNSTPALFVNGRRLTGSVPWATLKQVIDMELDHSKANPAAAGENSCCSLELKTPFSTPKK